MRFLKHTLFAFALIVGFSVASMAQDGNEGDKKTPPKPKPPVVIVNLDKKNEKPKENEHNSEENKPRTYFFSSRGKTE